MNLLQQGHLDDALIDLHGALTRVMTARRHLVFVPATLDQAERLRVVELTLNTLLDELTARRDA